jgi:hypothetical protein
LEKLGLFIERQMNEIKLLMLIIDEIFINEYSARYYENN